MFQPFPIFGRVLRCGFGRGNDGGEHVTTMLSRILTTQPANLIGYWPLGDLTGTVADDVSSVNTDGAYTGAFTLAQDGIGDGSKSALFSGGFVSLSANLANLNAAFVNTSGTLFGWVKVTNAGIWTDGLAHTMAELGADVNNRVVIFKDTVNNRLAFNHMAGGTTKSVTLVTTAPLNFFSVAITWDKNADQIKAYFNGAQTGATVTGLGVWAGALAAAWTGIANERSTVALDVWSGYLAHIATWKVALTAAEIARIGVLSAS